MRNVVVSGLVLSTATMLAYAEPPDKAREQMNEVTRAIFSVFAADREQPQRCEYDVQWDNYPVPGWLAKETLGLTLEVDVLASEQPLRVQDLLDPKKATKDGFCSKEGFTSYLEKRASTKEEKSVLRRSITYPVFDRDRKTAIITITNYEVGGHIKLQNGEVRQRATELAINAFVWKLTAGKWQIVRSETLAVT